MDKCPACERTLRRLEDFPLVYIIGFEKLQIPELIASLERCRPERSRWGFDRAYEDYEHMLGIVIDAVGTSQVRDSFKCLEGFVGKEVRTKEILTLPIFKPFKIGNYGNFLLSLGGRGAGNDNINIWTDCFYLHGKNGSGHFENTEIGQELARLEYEGKVN